MRPGAVWKGGRPVLRAKETTGGKVPSRREQGQQRDECGCREGSQRQRGTGPDRAGRGVASIRTLA